jgi:hypothetical protein
MICSWVGGNKKGVEYLPHIYQNMNKQNWFGFVDGEHQ